MKNFKEFNVAELPHDDLKNTNGGIGWGAIGVVVAVALYLLSEYDDIKDGVQDYNNGKEYNYTR